MRHAPQGAVQAFAGSRPPRMPSPCPSSRHAWGLGLLVAAVLGGCGGTPTLPEMPGGETPGPAATDALPPGWRWVTGIPLTSSVVADYRHDGSILESPHFLTYSDAVGAKGRLMYAEMAERAFTDVLAFFQLPAGEPLGMNPADVSTKFQLVFNLWEDRQQRSYRFGFLLHALGSPYCVSSPEGYAAMVEHETIHVFQARLMGEYWNVVPPWFKEGLAEHGAAWFGRIETAEQLHHALGVLAEFGLDPATMDLAALVGTSGDVNAAAYRMWGLIFRYLMDTKGLNRSQADLLALFEDVRSGTRSFRSAFEAHMGVSTDVLEANAADWLEDLF